MHFFFAAVVSVCLCAHAGPRCLAAPAAKAGTGADADAESESKRARSERHYRTGLDLFEAGNREQALVEFQLAHELYPSNDIVFMLAQCEYHIGQLTQARAHYEAYLANDPAGPAAETARVRLAAILRRPGILFLMTDPDEAEVVIEGERQRYEGQAPNEFPVPRGRYRVTVKKAGFQTESREVEIDNAQTRQMFFKLHAIPGRLRVRTLPRDAVLFVRGMRAENPYDQIVEAGEYELYAEAPSHASRRDRVAVAPGEVRDVEFQLEYVRRSGRPELIGFWIGMGALAGAGAVTAVIDTPVQVSRPITPANSLLLGGAAVGAGGAALFASAFAPDYLPDNLALQRIGVSWIGAAEGIGIALAIEPDHRPAWIGGALGLAAGTVAGSFLDRYPLRYGRAALVQSATGAGILAGMLAVPAFCIGGQELRSGECNYVRGASPKQSLAVLAGLNLGLGAGLAMAYLPDQSTPGPSWQTVLLVDFGGLAGALAGALVATLPRCTGASRCGFEDTPTTTRYALVGGGFGFLAGWWLTRNFETRQDTSRRSASVAAPQLGLPMPSLLPGTSGDGDEARGTLGMMLGGVF